MQCYIHKNTLLQFLPVWLKKFKILLILFPVLELTNGVMYSTFHLLGSLPVQLVVSILDSYRGNHLELHMRRRAERDTHSTRNLPFYSLSQMFCRPSKSAPDTKILSISCLSHKTVWNIFSYLLWLLYHFTALQY